MLLLVSSLVLCACANGLAVEEKEAVSSPPVYKTYAGVGRYFVDPLPRPWAEASKMCKMFNGHLAFPETAAELAVLKSILVEYNTSWAFIGWHDLFEEGKYITVQGQPLSGMEYEVPWSPGNPSGNRSQNCGLLGAQGINDFTCSGNYLAICEEEIPLSESGSLGYERIGPYGLFRMIKVDATWTEAVEFCRAQGAHLWIVNSADELAAVYDHYDTASWSFWHGTHHIYADQYFVTIFDKTLEEAGYSTWSPGEPNGTNVEHPYVVISKTGMLLQRVDIYYFICEYNPPN